MKKLLAIAGIIAFWLSWPFLYVYLKRGERTRVLLVAGDHVLLIRTWHGTGEWSLPGGGARAHEELHDAAVRELEEEVGIVLEPQQLIRLNKKTHSEYKLTFSCHYFYAQLPEQVHARPRLPEVLDVKWVPLAEIGAHRLGPDSKHALSAYDALIQ